MKLLKRWVLLLCTLLLTAAGAVLPWMVSSLQDARVGRTPETRQFDPVNLTLQTGGGVQETLLLLAGSYSDLDDLEWSGRTNLTEEAAADAARKAIRMLNENGLCALLPEESEEDGCTITAEPHFIMSMTESSLSAIVWVCWSDQQPENWIFIDDDTGKMVRVFFINTEANSKATYTEDARIVNSSWEPEEMAKLAEAWRQTLSDYYSIELTFSQSEAHVDYYSSVFKLHCGEGELRLEMVEDGTIYFNP